MASLCPVNNGIITSREGYIYVIVHNNCPHQLNEYKLLCLVNITLDSSSLLTFHEYL